MHLDVFSVFLQWDMHGAAGVRVVLGRAMLLFFFLLLLFIMIDLHLEF